KKLFGTVSIEGRPLPIQLIVASDDKVELPKDTPKLNTESARKIVEKTPEDGRIFDALSLLVSDAAAEKVSSAKLVNWIEITLKTAANYGPGWRHEVGIRTVEQLLRHKAFATMNLEVARQLDGELTEKGSALHKL